MNKKTIAAAAITVAVCAGIATFAAKTTQTAEKEAAKQNKAAQQKEQSEKARAALPILTLNDTDENDRRYGYEILYKHDGITIKHEKSLLSDDPEVTLSVTNDTDDAKTVTSLYIIPECYTSDAGFSVNVGPHSTETVTVDENITEYLNKGTDITTMKYRFAISDDKTYDLIYTKPITVNYSLNPTEPSHTSKGELIYEHEGFQLYLYGCSFNDENKHGRRVFFDVYAVNNTGEDLYFSAQDCKIYKGDDPQDAETSVNMLVPDGTGHYFYFYVHSKEGDVPDGDTISFLPTLIGAYDSIMYEVGDKLFVTIEQ